MDSPPSSPLLGHGGGDGEGGKVTGDDVTRGAGEGDGDHTSEGVSKKPGGRRVAFAGVSEEDPSTAGADWRRGGVGVFRRFLRGQNLKLQNIFGGNLIYIVHCTLIQNNIFF